MMNQILLTLFQIMFAWLFFFLFAATFFFFFPETLTYSRYFIYVSRGQHALSFTLSASKLDVV